MAFRSTGPTTLMLPAFNGATRKLVLAGIVLFLAEFALAYLASTPSAGFSLQLIPILALGRMPWQLVTYAFLAGGLLSTAFGLFALWTIGVSLEDARGSRWLLEYFFVSAIGGALIVSLLARAGVPSLWPAGHVLGLWPVSLALLLAYGRMNPEAEMRLYFVLKVKAKHLVAIFLLFYIASAVFSHDALSAATALANALCGFLYLRFGPRKGVQYAASEGWYGLRNAYYRGKRRRAAKKFTVYMKKQGKDVSIDSSGRYIDPNGTPRDPNDKRWMN